MLIFFMTGIFEFSRYIEIGIGIKIDLLYFRCQNCQIYYASTIVWRLSLWLKQKQRIEMVSMKHARDHVTKVPVINVYNLSSFFFCKFTDWFLYQACKYLPVQSHVRRWLSFFSQQHNWSGIKFLSNIRLTIFEKIYTWNYPCQYIMGSAQHNNVTIIVTQSQNPKCKRTTFHGNHYDVNRQSLDILNR